MTTHIDQFGDPIHITADPEDNTILIDIAPHEPNNIDTLRSLPLPVARALRDELTRLIDQQAEHKFERDNGAARWQLQAEYADEDAYNASHPTDPMATDTDH